MRRESVQRNERIESKKESKVWILERWYEKAVFIIGFVWSALFIAGLAYGIYERMMGL